MTPPDCTCGTGFTHSHPAYAAGFIFIFLARPSGLGHLGESVLQAPGSESGAPQPWDPDTGPLLLVILQLASLWLGLPSQRVFS